MSPPAEPGDAAPTTEEYLRATTVGDLAPLAGRVLLVDYDSAWPEQFQREATRIRAALGDRALRIEHIGSTAVPGLPAKPIVDVLLVVADSADEQAYLPALVDAGYVLRIREPTWYEHRLFKGPDTDVNLHVLSAGCPEIERHLIFRDWLRDNAGDRDLYARTKRELARRDWKYTHERLYPDQWVVVEVTRVDRANQPRAGRVLAHAPDEDEITREAVKAAEERPTAHLWTFYTGERIPEGMIVIFGCR